MNPRILMTGSSGLVGSALAPVLETKGAEIKRLDLRASGLHFGDIRDRACVRRAVEGCDGIVHLAAVSRVIWGEEDPERCRATNVMGLHHILEAAASSPARPWLIFASSREVYGQPEHLPADENCPLRPVNVYGRTKVEGERLVAAAQRDGMRACVVRLSNVYGSTADHEDRVVPAFARAALSGQRLRVDGVGHIFDFTHIEDVARGFSMLAELLASGERPPPPLQLVSGVPTALGELAAMVIRMAGRDATVVEAPPRDFDVVRFVGDPARAKALLGWRAEIGLEEGLSRLIEAFRGEYRSDD